MDCIILRYNTFNEIGQHLDALYNEYPQFVKEKISIGTTLEGRDIWAIKLSDNPNIDEDEAEILYSKDNLKFLNEELDIKFHPEFHHP